MATAKAPPAEPSKVENVYRVVKLAAVVLGFPGSLICLMALFGAFAENGYVRVIGAIVVALGLPLFIADRMLDKDPNKRSRGLVTDVVAIFWLGVVVVFAGVLNGATRSLFATEGDRLTSGGYPSLAWSAYFLGGLNVTPAPTPRAATSVTASASAAPSSSPGVPSASASVSATPGDAGAH